MVSAKYEFTPNVPINAQHRNIKIAAVNFRKKKKNILYFLTLFHKLPKHAEMNSTAKFAIVAFQSISFIPFPITANKTEPTHRSIKFTMFFFCFLDEQKCTKNEVNEGKKQKINTHTNQRSVWINLKIKLSSFLSTYFCSKLSVSTFPLIYLSLSNCVSFLPSHHLFSFSLALFLLVFSRRFFHWTFFF